MHTLKVRSEEGEVRLDRFLRRHLKKLQQSVLQKLCRKGLIRVDGKKSKPSTRVRPGEVITYPEFLQGAPAQEAKAMSPATRKKLLSQFEAMLLYVDPALFVLNKPPGLAVQGGTSIGHHIDQMLDALSENAPYRPHLVHRLDRDTSGVLVIARTPEMASYLTKAFREREVKKKYWAITVATPRHVSGYIGSDKAQQLCSQGALAQLRYVPKDIFALSCYQVIKRSTQGLAWLVLSPLTGRKHQLRIHCSLLKTPIWGDDKYGGRLDKRKKRKTPLHLHARSLEIPHPTKGHLRLTAPLPDFIERDYKELGFL